MPITTMSLIARQTVGAGGAASITFSNIPQTFTDLKVVMSTRSSGTSSVQIQFNGSASNRSNIRLYYSGTTPASFSGSDVFTYQNRGTYSGSTFDNSEIYIPNYRSSNFKCLSIDNVTETMASSIDNQLQAGLWSQTAAITSLGFVPDNSQTFVEFTEISLYGISNNTATQNTSVPYASGGDIITTDGSFWYHAFRYSGIFTPLRDLSADVLVIAGGGAGATRVGGGGGAGGVCYKTSNLLTAANSYVCTVGAGGAGVAVFTIPSNGGGASSIAGSGFSTITANGGGFGGTFSGVASAGGSGGGGGYGDTPWITGGASNQTGSGGSTGYGNAGGNGVPNGSGSGGGGGSGAVGANAVLTGGGGGGSGGNSNSGAGGAGLNTWSSWASATSTGVSGFYAGGGGGGGRSDATTSVPGAGGSGGGGAGATSTNTATSGAVNTGSGGGGAWDGTTGSGGSGIIVVRYAV
jgi:hypothetical protein